MQDPIHEGASLEWRRELVVSSAVRVGHDLDAVDRPFRTEGTTTVQIEPAVPELAPPEDGKHLAWHATKRGHATRLA